MNLFADVITGDTGKAHSKVVGPDQWRLGEGNLDPRGIPPPATDAIIVNILP
jgi:hypothetical protein